MKQEITMGSLFSGSGGFELAGSIFGIRPIWASEIEPFPILVTTKNFPEMKHLGDINKLNGADLEPVTIIAGGSPCQDMSIAGKREGLDGSRSNLFREQIRIIKEMRESDRAAGRTGKQIRPRYMVWENVPGAYSSNKGEDFRCVLEEICQISEGNVSIPRPPKNKWGGQGATHPQPITLQIRSGCEGGGKGALMQTDKSATLSTHNTQTLFDPIPIADKATRYKGGGDTRNNDGSANGLGIGEPGAPANTLTAADRHGVACFAQQAIGEYEESEKASCLKRRDYKDSTDLILWEYIIRRLTPLECCRLQGFPDNWAEELGIPEPTQEDIDHWREVFRTQMEAMGESKKEKTDNQIRKWLKDPESDSAKYKMWGNGIALPCAMFVMEGIAMILSEEDADEQQ